MVSCDLDDLSGLEKYRHKADYTEVKKVHLQIFVEVIKWTNSKMAEQQQIREGAGRRDLQPGEKRARSLQGRHLDMKRVAQNAEEAIDWNKLSDARKVKSLRLFVVFRIKRTPEEKPGTRQRSCAEFVAGAALSQGQVFPRFELRGRRSTFARSGAYFVAGAALLQGQVQISWQVQLFRKAKCRFCGKRSTFARSSTELVAGAALSQGQVQISWQAKHFRKVKYRFRGRGSTFASSGTEREREIDR